MGGRLDAAVGHHHGAQRLLLLDEVGVLQRQLEAVIELLEHGGRRALGRVQAVPDREFEILEPHLTQGRVVLQQLVVGHWLGGGDGKCLDPAGFDLLRGIGGLVAHQVHLPAQQGIHRRGRATIGDGGHGFGSVDGGLPHQAAQVRGRTQPGVGNVELAGVGLDVVLEVAVGVGRQLRLAYQGHRYFIDQTQELEVFQRLVLDLLVERGRCRHADMEQQQRMAVGSGPRDLGGTDGAARTGRVFHQEGRARNGFAHGFAKLPRHQVGRAAGCEWHHHGDGLAARKTLCIGKQRTGSGSNNKQTFHFNGSTRIGAASLGRHGVPGIAENT